MQSLQFRTKKPIKTFNAGKVLDSESFETCSHRVKVLTLYPLLYNSIIESTNSRASASATQDNMRIQTVLLTAVYFLITTSAHPTEETTNLLEKRQSCTSNLQPCVRYYGGGGCTTEIGNYVPTCAGNCFQYDAFTGLKVKGGGAGGKGTDCQVFSDINCQNQLYRTGNQVSQTGCFGGLAKSMKCYYNC
ncbi:MAG: hypothetical protein M1831_006001 [Alyxoria varia]|nr:MAG: hypothetical protein M1831_006001 [Alyxoria varia]